jgi:aryl-alcohol dehydrogenase-like predicted oxidoreductase
MLTRPLGSTGLSIAPISFGAGPVSQLLVGEQRQSQLATIARAVELGVRWFDTAATYGEGRSEENLGRALAELGMQDKVDVATKVRIMPDELGRIGEVARASVAASLQRLRCERVTLLQVHNSITAEAGAQPTSLTPGHLLASGGLLEVMDQMRSEGLVEHLGLTGLGEAAALKEVIESRQFATIQTPYHLLNASAGHDAPPGFAETDYGNVIAACQRQGMGVFVIRVLAGGALAGKPPSPHTLKTPFFPLKLYQQDCARAEQIAEMLPAGVRREEAAVRFALSHPAVTSAIIGFATPAEVAEAVSFAYRGPLGTDLLRRLTDFAWDQPAQAQVRPTQNC